MNKEKERIPKIIHYCWFGKKEKPDSVMKCIASWQQHCPEYEIKEWNEDNFDFSSCAYANEAYQAKKWAFVSDYARFWILYNYGGIYFDTDVEVIKPIDEIINAGPFFGMEAMSGQAEEAKVAPGLGLAVWARHPLYKEIIEKYNNMHFISETGILNETTVVEYITDVVKGHGFKNSLNIQNIEGILIYPPDYFCPQNYSTGKMEITENTISIHHYSATWHSGLDDIILKIEKCKSTDGTVYKIKRAVSLPFRVVNKIKKNGVKKVLHNISK